MPKQITLVETTLGSVATIEMGQSPPGSSYNNEGRGVPLINGPTEFTDRHPVPVQWTDSPTKMCKVGDLLLCVRGSSVGRINISNAQYCIGRGVAAIRARDDEFNQGYLIQLIQYEVERMVRLSTGSTFPNVDKNTLANTPVRLPTLGEQCKIAEILRTWDVAIQATDQFLGTRISLVDALTRDLMTGRSRLSSHRVPWPTVSLADVTTPVSLRNGQKYTEVRVMAVTKLHGMVPMRDHVRADDISRYKIVPPNGFAYNPMRLNIGSIAKNVLGQEILVSPDYVAFTARPEVLDHRYLDHLRRTTAWSKFVENAGNGSVRVRIYYEDLGQMALKLPPLDEQRAIAEVLDTARLEIAILERKRIALERQKRGLMQKLLTGTWRVKVD